MSNSFGSFIIKDEIKISNSVYLKCSSDTSLQPGYSGQSIKLRNQYLLNLCDQFVIRQAKIETVCTICTQKWNPDVQMDVVRDLEGQK